MSKATFHCASCGRVIIWAQIIGYGYGFVHKTRPKTLCVTPKHPEPREGEE